MVTTKPMTVEEFERLPADREGFRYELVRGELRRMPAGGLRHGGIGADLTIDLGLFVRSRGLGKVFNAETGFRLFADQDTVLAPDVSFVSAARLASIANPDRFGPFAPDFVVEVVSPTDRMAEVLDKVKVYLDAGVRLVWVVEPKRRVVTVYGPGRPPRELGVGETLDGGEVLPELRLAVADIFAA